MNVKILVLSKQFEHQSSLKVCFLLWPNNYKHEAQAFVNMFSPKAWMWCNNNLISISMNFLQLNDEFFWGATFQLIFWWKHTLLYLSFSMQTYCDDSIFKSNCLIGIQFVFLSISSPFFSYSQTYYFVEINCLHVLHYKVWLDLLSFQEFFSCFSLKFDYFHGAWLAC